MSKEEAIRLIILDYCNNHNITPTEFARKAEISKPYINKIVNNKHGKYGISMTFSEKIAQGMNIDMVEFQKMIKKLQQNENAKIDFDISKESIINNINEELYKFPKSDLDVIHSIIKNSNSEKLNILHSFLKNMK